MQEKGRDVERQRKEQRSVGHNNISENLTIFNYLNLHGMQMSLTIALFLKQKMHR